MSRKDVHAIAGASRTDPRTVKRRLNGKPILTDRAEAIDAAIVALGINVPPRAPSP